MDYQEALIREVLYGPNTQLPWLKESYKNMRVLVCGGRDFNDPVKMNTELYGLYKDAQLKGGKIDLCIIQGGAHGADSLAKEWAEGRGLAFETYYADWEKHGKSAGPIRNQTMLEQGKPDLVVAFPGGRGTADMVKRATQAGIRVREVT